MTTTAAGARAEIAEEHRVLRTTLERLEATTDLAVLVPALDELRGLLEVHFAREEREDGLHQVIGDAGPHLLTQVQILFDEHRDCLDRLRSLEGAARECFEGPVSRILEGISALCRRLHEHEARETELLAGAIYDDVGEAS